MDSGGSDPVWKIHVQIRCQEIILHFFVHLNNLCKKKKGVVLWSGSLGNLWVWQNVWKKKNTNAVTHTDFLFSKNRPYFGKANDEVIKQIVDGYRLDKPEKCPLEVYAIMQSEFVVFHAWILFFTFNFLSCSGCWLENPEQRPNFVQIHNEMSKLLLPLVEEEDQKTLKEVISDSKTIAYDFAQYGLSKF